MTDSIMLASMCMCSLKNRRPVTQITPLLLSCDGAQQNPIIFSFRGGYDSPLGESTYTHSKGVYTAGKTRQIYLYSTLHTQRQPHVLYKSHKKKIIKTLKTGTANYME